MMTPERWQQVKCVLEEALEIAPEQRPSFLDRACSTDHSLRREVESLLSSSNDVPSSFLKSSPNAGLRLSKGTRLGDFEILSLLGVGGMGEVYRARDRRLDRDVAIKVLPQFVSFDHDRLHRFEQEAKAAAALNHANILAVFQMGTYEGAPYLVSELLEGETLREQLKHGPIPLKEATDYAIQIVHGLAAAHGKGVVHRDLKPENLFVTRDGGIKILDFGLAKLTHQGSETQLAKQTLDTEPGAVLGTVGYMSPEQVRGQATDHRSDIFAFGAILYEMLSGRRAFHKATSAETMTAILNEEPPLLSRAAPNISPALGQAVHRCLDKNPEQRFQSAADLVSVLPASAETKAHALQTRKTAVRVALAVAALLALSALSIGLNVRGLRDRLLDGVSSPTIRSIAVLPLTNLTGDSGQEYFVDGVTDELTTNLAQIAALRVPSRSSAMQFKDTKKPVSQIARSLNVDAVVEGSVMRSGDRVRITAQLIEAKTDRHLWARSYERDSRDIMALQDELARDIAEEIRVTLTPGERKRFAGTRTPNLQAYDAYLRGRYFWNRRTEAELHKAEDYFEQAIAADPGYAPAYSGLADTYFYLSYGWGHMPPREGMPLARAAALKAVELDNSGAEGYASLAAVKFLYDWDFPGSEDEAKRAIALSPNYELGHHVYSVLLAATGRSDESVAEARKAVEVDPLSIPASNILGAMLVAANRCDEAILQSKQAMELDPNPTHLAMFHGRLAKCYARKGMDKESLEEEVKMRLAQGASPQAIEEVRKTYAASGHKGVLMKDQQVALARWEKNHWHADAFEIAMRYADLGEDNQAFAWIDKAIELRSTTLIWIYIGDNPLKHDPRFAEVKRKMGILN